MSCWFERTSPSVLLFVFSTCFNNLLCIARIRAKRGAQCSSETYWGEKLHLLNSRKLSALKAWEHVWALRTVIISIPDFYRNDSLSGLSSVCVCIKVEMYFWCCFTVLNLANYKWGAGDVARKSDGKGRKICLPAPHRDIQQNFSPSSWHINRLVWCYTDRLKDIWWRLFPWISFTPTACCLSALSSLCLFIRRVLTASSFWQSKGDVKLLWMTAREEI